MTHNAYLVIFTPMLDRDPKTVAINELSRELKERENELARLKESISKISLLEGEIATLQASLKLLRGHDEHEGVGPQPSLANHASNGNSLSLPSIVYKILKQANRPLGPGEVVELGPTNGKTINYHSLTSMMSAKIYNGELFYREGSGKDGKYGLLEWKERDGKK